MKTFTVEEIAKMGANYSDFIIAGGFTYHEAKENYKGEKFFWLDRQNNHYTSEELFKFFCKNN